MGCYSDMDIERIQKFVGVFKILWPEPTEFEKAYSLLALHRLTSGLSIPDCLIAAMALTRSARLYTFNRKHFKIVAGLDVEEPYPRS